MVNAPRFALLLVQSVLLAAPVIAQEIQSQPAGPIEPKEAFAENSPLSDARFDEAEYNAKEQRLREHYLPTPIGELPAGRDLQEAAESMPAPTEVQGAEAAAVQIIQNRPLTDIETNNGTSIVCEPSLAVRGNEILYTGNWFASFSTDGGATFRFRNPSTIFPPIPNRDFCCDQVAYYVPSHDLMVWFLQHVKDGTGNTIRLAVAHGDDIRNERWRLYDFTPQQVGNWSGEWFDYPDIAASQQHLFITTNTFSLANQFTRAVTLRLPLSQLRDYATLNYRFFHKTDVGSLRPVQGQQAVMHIGSHLNTGTLRVFAWPDSAEGIQSKDFAVNAWIRGGASSPGPDGNDWLGFVDGRITGAWSSGNRQGFAWTSAQGGSFPQPNIRVAVIDWNAGTVVHQPHVWNPAFAFAYPAAACNSTGGIGVAFAFGGGQLHPSHAIGVLDSSFAWSLVTTVNGTNAPDINRWGDYLSVRLHGTQQNRFVTTGYTLSAGSNNENIVPRIVQFDAQFTSPATSPREEAPIATLEVREVEAAESSSAAPTPANGAQASWSHALAEAAEPSNSQASARSAAAAIDDDPNERKRRYSWEEGAARARPTKEVFDLAAAASSRRGLGGVDDIGTPTVLSTKGDANVDAYQEVMALPSAAIFFYEPPESVCSPDERTQIMDTQSAPWNSNCQLIITFQNGARAVGSGWFLGPRLVVTAGHCVHMGAGGGFFKSVEVIPGMNGADRPFGSQVSTELRASELWKSDGVQAADYGAIILPSEFSAGGQSPGTVEAAVLGDEELQSVTVAVSGYPADKPAGTQWSHGGPIDSAIPNRLFYSIDTAGGHSGSKVTCIRNGGVVAVGIHNYGGCPNKCTRINGLVMEDLQKWLQESNAH